MQILRKKPRPRDILSLSTSEFQVLKSAQVLISALPVAVLCRSILEMAVSIGADTISIQSQNMIL